MASAFDTLQAAREIEDAGLDRAPAEAIAQAIHRRSEAYATKVDIAALRVDIGAIRAEVATMIEKAKNAVLLSILAAVGILASIDLFA